ncbi:MAG TPA: class I SAM-dependent methyltransferase [Mycobacteriales bacterium]|nr:class I SAM-dependent methyltransferase [Mycobacteriales bacterium]
MSRFYSIAYAVGFTPWERAARADAETLPRFLTREEAEHGGPGRALDLGCGSGAHTALLAERGWKVTGVDLVPKALRRARERIAQRGLTANFVQSDVTELPPEAVGTGFDFFLDVGCFHGLAPGERRSMASAVTAIAAPDASLLMLAFKAGAAPRPLPRGADQADIEADFPGWSVTDVEPAATEGMPRPLRRVAPSWYRLRRQS